MQKFFEINTQLFTLKFQKIFVHQENIFSDDAEYLCKDKFIYISTS